MLSILQVNWKHKKAFHFSNDYLFPVRPTEIAESDVFVCESVYDEHKKQIRKTQAGQGLRKFTHSQMVTPDEIYHFKRPIAPVKVDSLMVKFITV